MQKYNLSNREYIVDSGEFNCSLTEEVSADSITELHLHLSAEKPIIPNNITVVFRVDSTDVFSVWSPSVGYERNIRPDWSPTITNSRSVVDAPVTSLISKSGSNKITASLSDADNAHELKVGANEYDAHFVFKIVLFTQLSDAMGSYDLTIRLDTRNIPYYKALDDVQKWWQSIGYKSAYVPAAALEPLYSTWYNFHHVFTTDELVDECRLAAEYGMKTIIIDDGWQLEGPPSGYAYCGDWKLAKSKIPDMKEFTDKVHSIGMKVMIWYSVPFIGMKSEIHDHFKGMYLKSNVFGASVLDPRFKEVRDYLSETYATAASNWNLDGLKLDFIDRFALSEESSTDYDKMDCITLTEGIQKLLDEVSAKLREINPEFLIEFRQRYTGPVVRKYGNMLRVTDCPNSSLSNRVRSIDIRLISGNTAVHSDMVMWSYNESAEDAANQIINSLFCVPQISMLLHKLSESHKNMLRFYLDFWSKNREVLLDGELIPQGPEANYSVISSKKEDCNIIACYSNNVAQIDSDTKTTFVINGTGSNQIILKNSANATLGYHIYNCEGQLISSGSLTEKLIELTVPVSGIVEIVN